MSRFVLGAGLFSWIGDWFYGLWVNLWLLIDNVVYAFVDWSYRVFLLVAKVDIFGGGERIKEITERLYLIVGVVMLFIFAYNLILLIINPEGNQTSNMAKLVQRSLISIILVTLLPTIYSYLTTVQSHVLDSNVIGHVIFGGEAPTEANNKKAGTDVALKIFSAFYRPEGETYQSCKDGGTHNLCTTYVKAYDNAYDNVSVSDFVWNDSLKSGAKKGSMEYSWVLSTIAGICALWMFISFGLDIGVRVAKLAFFQVISPIPVMMRIMPGDKMFDKWFKGLKDTYISLFIRLAVIFLCMYAIGIVPEALSEMWATNSDTGIILALANVVLILGILKFAQEAPNLIGDILSTGGAGLNFGIASKIRENKYAMAGMGAAGAGAGAMASNAWNSWKKMGTEKGVWNKTKALGKGFASGAAGFVGGARRGLTSGYKSDSFKGLGKGITQSKLDSDEARDKRSTRHVAYRQNGKINGKEIPFVSNAYGRVKAVGESVSSGVQRAGDWITNSNATEHRGAAINDVKSKSKAVKDGKYYNQGTYSSAQKDQWLEEIRKGGKVTIGDKEFKMDRKHSYEDVQNAVKAAIDGHNKNKTVANYKENADLLANDIKQLLTSLTDNQAAIGKEGMECFARELKSAISKNSSNNDLKKLMNGDQLDLGEITDLLSMNKSEIEHSSDQKRAAIYEVTQALDKGMARADALNMQKNVKNDK